MPTREEALHRLLAGLSAGKMPDDALRAVGFREPARLREGLERLRSRGEVTTLLDAHYPDLFRALVRSCDPDRAFGGLERWLEAGGANQPAEGAAWSDGAFLRLLAALFAATPALAEYFIHWPARTAPVLTPVLARKMKGGRAWARALRGALSEAETHAAQLAALRRARTEALLQIASLDLLGISPLEDTLRALSDLADACVQAALDTAIARLRPLFGVAHVGQVSKLAPLSVSTAGKLGDLPYVAPAQPETPPPPPFVIFAMGKLGGRELNYSSDIDLVFAYSGDGPTEGGPRAVEHREYFTRLGEEILDLLRRATEDGRAYRVDLRLRPYGGAGALVLSVAETLEYLQDEGRTWERQAWLKARPVAGDLDLGDAFLLDATTFIYRRYLSLDAIGDIQALKRQSEAWVEQRGETDDEVKLGRGGIRDIEFTVQFLQLMHGGQHAAVRGGHTLRALRELRRQNLLALEEAEALERAYVFWRHVEHRLQLHGDLQTHRLPADLAARRRVARSLGFTDLPADAPPAQFRDTGVAAGAAAPAWFPPQGPLAAEDWFERERAYHSGKVRAVFEHLFSKLFPEREGSQGELSEALLVPEPEPEKIAQLLPAFGFTATPENAKEVLALGKETALLANPSRTRRFFASVAPLLLRALAATGDPDGALRRFSRLAGSLGGKAIFFQALHENPWLLKMTADLAAWSEYLTDILVANPGLFDEVVDALRIGQSKSCAQMEAELGALALGGDVGDTLRAYRAGELLRIGVRDLFHAVPIEQTQGELADLATAVLRAQLAHTRKAMSAARGEPRGADGAPAGFAVLAVGKFGGRELNYGSDLDVLFFYDVEGATPEGFPAGPYFCELAQDLSRAMGTPTTLGNLYTLDARLRPNGGKGPLASSLAAFERYWRDGKLADWERLALTRARLVAGDAGVGERGEHLIRSAVYSPLAATPLLAQEVRAMRKRLEETAEPGNLKRGRGGIVDIEFLAQYLQLLHGPAYPPIRQTNTEAALKALLRFKKLEEADGQRLLEAFRFLTRMANRVRIVHGLSANALPAHAGDLQKLALRAGYADTPGQPAGAALLADYHRHTEAVRALYEKVVV